MDRRTVLAQMGAVVATGLSGCTAADDGGNASDGNETATNDTLATENGTATESGEETQTESWHETEEPVNETPTEADDELTSKPVNETSTEPDDGTAGSSDSESGFRDASLNVVESGCGQERDEAAIAFESDESEVVVTGTIWGSDSCKVAELVDAQYDAGADELSVTVGTADPETDEPQACAQCLTEIDYRMTAAFDGDLPATVTVAHDHGDGAQTVATASQS